MKSWKTVVFIIVVILLVIVAITPRQYLNQFINSVAYRIFNMQQQKIDVQKELGKVKDNEIKELQKQETVQEKRVQVSKKKMQNVQRPAKDAQERRSRWEALGVHPE